MKNNGWKNALAWTSGALTLAAALLLGSAPAEAGTGCESNTGSNGSSNECNDLYKWRIVHGYDSERGIKYMKMQDQGNGGTAYATLYCAPGGGKPVGMLYQGSMDANYGRFECCYPADGALCDQKSWCGANAACGDHPYN